MCNIFIIRDSISHCIPFLLGSITEPWPRKRMPSIQLHLGHNQSHKWPKMARIQKQQYMGIIEDGLLLYYVSTKQRNNRHQISSTAYTCCLSLSFLLPLDFGQNRRSKEYRNSPEHWLDVRLKKPPPKLICQIWHPWFFFPPLFSFFTSFSLFIFPQLLTL